MKKENQLRLSNGNVIHFNEEQIIAVNKIKDWLVDDNTKMFTLSGYAGTGKSTIIKKILDEYKHRVVVSAPTHKAKRVVAKITNRKGETLHSLLGLRPDINLDDFNPNDPIFNPIAIPKICDFDLVVIDEASMINENLYELIKQKSDNCGVKVLFVGDSAQIPPVKEQISVVFENTLNDIATLTQVMRQSNDNPITSYYDDLRNNLLHFDGGMNRTSCSNDKNEGILFINNKPKFKELLLEKFNSLEFEKSTDFVKLIAWKNNTVQQSNSVIRKSILGDNVNVIELNDVLMGYRSISDEKNRYNLIENSGDYKVIRRSEKILNKSNLYGYEVKLRENINESQYNYVDIFIVDSYDENNLHHYAELHDFFKDRAKSNKSLWRDYYDFRRNNIILTTIIKHRNGENRKSSDVIVKDMDYGYCITAHKSQGSTYSHVFILEDDINDNSLIKERNQIKYVALTRPSISATILTSKLII